MDRGAWQATVCEVAESDATEVTLDALQASTVEAAEFETADTSG